MAGMEAAMGEPGSGPAGSTGSPDGGAAGGYPPGNAPGGSSGSTDGNQGSGPYGQPGGSGTGGPLTPAEQVAILDARLEQGTGEFDSMILEEQQEQRRTAREQTSSNQSESGQSGTGGSSGAPGGAGEGGMADAGGYGGGGGYSTGGGMGGAGGSGGDVPQNTAKYPPPKDIPSGSDDDVVARQLREAAMREPDPAVREKLWDEYRKYKGISE